MSSTTIKSQNTGLDFQKVGIIKDSLINPVTTAQRTTLAGTLGVNNKGLAAYDTDELKFYVWTGTAFAVNPVVQSGLTPRGNVAYNATEPVSPLTGDLYVFTTAGTNTWNTSDVVQIGDYVYWDGTIWQFVQGNVVLATTSIAGIVQIATQGEVNTGTDTSKSVTPATLKSWSETKALAKVYFVTGLTLVADTPLTVTHNLGLQNRNSFTFNLMISNSSADVDVDSIDANNLSLTSSVAATADITIIGY